MSAYAGTKFALRGLAESLAMELRPYNISVTLSLPPDTDTPGFATEQLTKPLETHLISKAAGLVDPAVVAEKMFKDARVGTRIMHATVECSNSCFLSLWYNKPGTTRQHKPLKTS